MGSCKNYFSLKSLSLNKPYYTARREDILKQEQGLL